MTEQTDADRLDFALAFHRRHRKRLGVCWRCLRRYPCPVVSAFERGYVVGWDAAVRTPEGSDD